VDPDPGFGSGSATLGLQVRVKYLWLDVIDGLFDLSLHVIQLLLANLATITVIKSV
jgi:hypothetical protein